MNNHSYLFFNATKLLAKIQAPILYQHFIKKISSKIITKTHYETLNISRRSTTKEIKDAFITLSKKYHPDKNKDNPTAQQQFVKVNEAYSVLIKPETRKDYDLSLEYYGHPAAGPTSSSDYRNFYGARRQRSYEEEDYGPREDPWKDPSFFRNWKHHERPENDEYYGIKGIKKQTNETVLKWIFVFVALGIVLQVSIIRFWRLSHFTSDERVKEMNRRYYESVRARANSYPTNKEALEAMENRIRTKQKEDDK